MNPVREIDKSFWSWSDEICQVGIARNLAMISKFPPNDPDLEIKDKPYFIDKTWATDHGMGFDRESIFVS